MNKVEKLFINKGAVVMRPNNKWFVMSKQNSVKFIEACEIEKIRILGIDGFYLRENGGIESSMANSVDFTSLSYKGEKENIYAKSLQFIESREDDLYFEIICED